MTSGRCGVLFASTYDAKRRVCTFALIVTQKENTCRISLVQPVYVTRSPIE